MTLGEQSMTKAVQQAFLDAFGTVQTLTSPETRDIVGVIGSIISAHPDPVTFFTDAQKSLEGREALRTAIRRFLSSEKDFQTLMVLIGSVLDDEWLANLARTIGDTLAEREDVIAWWFLSINADNCTPAMARSLLLFSRHIREQRAAAFRTAFATFLAGPGHVRGLILAASVLDESDKALIEPLKDLISRLRGHEYGDRNIRKEQNITIAQLEAAISKVEGKPQSKRWWKFGT